MTELDKQAPACAVIPRGSLYEVGILEDVDLYEEGMDDRNVVHIGCIGRPDVSRCGAATLPEHVRAKHATHFARGVYDGRSVCPCGTPMCSYCRLLWP